MLIFQVESVAFISRLECRVDFAQIRSFFFVIQLGQGDWWVFIFLTRTPQLGFVVVTFIDRIYIHYSVNLHYIISNFSTAVDILWEKSIL
jgi:hypothetical protein